MPPRFASRKKQGEWAELVLMQRLSGFGLNLSKPIGDTAPYDVVAESRRGRLHKLQGKSVGSTERHRSGVYAVSCGYGHRAKRAYLPRHIDFLAVYVIPEDLWYIIPVHALRRQKRIRVCPSQPARLPRFEPYREAWHQLF
jgi:hypothetical protein